MRVGVSSKKHEIPDKYDSEDGVETDERRRKTYRVFSETQDERRQADEGGLGMPSEQVIAYGAWRMGDAMSREPTSSSWRQRRRGTEFGGWWWQEARSVSNSDSVEDDDVLSAFDSDVNSKS
ncbi:hypothetical protein B0H13DRAFT_1921449 [Mycena leptocephala]|nr:hypothetical protein B0H13DRAFT_1921449 [Mycena leptocephala]